MKNTILLLMIPLILGALGCDVKDPEEANKDLQKKINDSKKKNIDFTDMVIKSLQQGGQPGKIDVMGVLVNESGALDPRVTVISRGGVGKDGTRAPLANDSKPTLSNVAGKTDLSFTTEMKTLISFGCDSKVVAEFARVRSLEVLNLPKPKNDVLVSVAAKTIVLCGNLQDADRPDRLGQSTHFYADEIIMDGVDFTMTKIIGSLRFQTHKLVLRGENRIGTQGPDSEIAVSVTSSLELKVLNEISSEPGGQLLLMSSGSDYKAGASAFPTSSRQP